MARLNKAITNDSGDELPEVSKILGYSGVASANKSFNLKGKEQHSGVIHSRPLEANGRSKESQGNHKEKVSFARHGQEQSRKQPTLSFSKSEHAKRPHSALPQEFPHFLTTSNLSILRDNKSNDVRSSPRRAAKLPINYAQFVTASSEDEISSAEEDDSHTDLSGFIVSDTESIEIGLSKTSSKEVRRKLAQKPIEDDKFNVTRLSSRNRASAVIDLRSPSLGRQADDVNDVQNFSSSSSDCERRLTSITNNDQPLATIRFSPSRSRSPPKFDFQHTATPPSSPSKSKLQSPSKRVRIPATPHRPSIDAFWSQEVIDEWNDQYSPKKTPLSTYRSKPIILDESDEDLSPCASPRKSSLKSHKKRDKAATERRKLFNAKKDEIATIFLAEVDRTVTGGQVSSLAESTGGIKIIWSKKLSSTAGRANWRREAIRQRSAEGTTSSVVTTAHRHHASIELAEKVIDDENRLMNVLAHEYCHLANFMISGIKNNPHGKEFKQWAAKCTNAFKHRGVEVTTKHNYDISYKYIWQCTEVSCGLEYKRHSKSIDPSKHTCGACKGKLMQIQPALRKGLEAGKRSEYQEFVKAEYEHVKRERPGVGFGEVMAVLGKEFREKKRMEAEAKVGVKENNVVHVEDGGVDGVLKDLNELHLG